MAKDTRALLVGDNPFHGVSHLSLERARARGEEIGTPAYAAQVVLAALESGANGCLFSVNQTTLAILRVLSKAPESQQIQLYTIVPYTYEFVRLAVLLGGIQGLANKVAGEIVSSGNWRAMLHGLRGVVGTDTASLFKAYLAYEVSRLRAATGNRIPLVSVLIHEIVTDMALGLNMTWFFKAYLDCMTAWGLRPGFNTRNLPYLVRAFHRWGISLEGLVLAAPFNAIGFQMCPSREACESTLAEIPEADVVAFSLFAGGYGSPKEAVAYAANLPNLKGVVLGVSRVEQARESFALFREALS